MTMTADETARLAATPSYQQYKLNHVSKIAHDAVVSSEQCNLDDAAVLVFKPSIPPDYRLCAHCAARLAELGMLAPRLASIATAVEGVGVEVEAAAVAQQGKVGAETSRDPTRGDGRPLAAQVSQAGNFQLAQALADKDAEIAQLKASVAAPSPPAAQTRKVIPFPLGPGSVGFRSPDSSNIEGVTWFGGDGSQPGSLIAEFKGGARYVYRAVPLDVYIELFDAESVGSAFDELVKKGGFEYRLLEVDELRDLHEVEDHAPTPPAPARGRGRNPTRGETEMTAEEKAAREQADRAAAEQLSRRDVTAEDVRLAKAQGRNLDDDD